MGTNDITTVQPIEYDAVLYGHMTPAEAAAYLQDGRVVPRSFGETLRLMYPYADLQSRLTGFFAAQPGAEARAVRRNVRNWLGSRHRPSNRRDVFGIAFALRLTEQQLDHLLCVCTDYGIQYRNGWEAVFSWFLRNGRPWQEAADFYGALPVAPGLDQVTGREASQLTREIRDEMLLAVTLPELEACYRRNLDKFGSLHLRAYYYFELYMRQLIRPEPPWADEEERDYSVETVMETYLTVHMPSGASRKGFSVVQRLVKQNWPNATSLKNIRLHKEDVPRKLLLLLYVVTENVGVQDGPYNEDYGEEDLTVEERLDDHWWTLNALLADCGMAPLDPRNATDWLILYCMCGDPDEPMSDRLEQVIKHMFKNIRE